MQVIESADYFEVSSIYVTETATETEKLLFQQ